MFYYIYNKKNYNNAQFKNYKNKVRRVNKIK